MAVINSRSFIVSKSRFGEGETVRDWKTWRGSKRTIKRGRERATKRVSKFGGESKNGARSTIDLRN